MNKEKIEQTQNLFNSSVGKTVEIKLENREKFSKLEPIPVNFTKTKIVGVVENIRGNKVYLNINGCLTIIPFDWIYAMIEVKNEDEEKDKEPLGKFLVTYNLDEAPPKKYDVKRFSFRPFTPTTICPVQEAREEQYRISEAISTQLDQWIEKHSQEQEQMELPKDLQLVVFKEIDKIPVYQRDLLLTQQWFDKSKVYKVNAKVENYHQSLYNLIDLNDRFVSLVDVNLFDTILTIKYDHNKKDA